MGNFLTKLVTGKGEERQVSIDQFFDGLGSHKTAAKRPVTPTTAMQVSTVWACVRILSDTVSTLPLDCYIRQNGVRFPFRPKPQWLLFQNGPWTKVDVLSQAMVSLLIDGNAFLATYRDNLGQLVWVEVLDPTQVKVERIGAELIYWIGNSRLTNRDILHIRGMTMAGDIRGMSPIAYAKESIALADAATIYGGAFFGNGARAGTVVEVPGAMSPTGKAALREAWNDIHQGAGNAGRLAVLTEGAKFSSVSVPPNEAQFLETRGFQVTDIARIYGVPTSLLAYSGGIEQGTTIEEKNLSFVQHGVRAWVERLEAGLSWLLISDGTNPDAFTKFTLDGLLRGDFETRWNIYLAAIREGAMTINEARALEDMRPVDWGDKPISVQVQGSPVPNQPPASGGK